MRLRFLAPFLAALTLSTSAGTAQTTLNLRLYTLYVTTSNQTRYEIKDEMWWRFPGGGWESDPSICVPAKQKMREGMRVNRLDIQIRIRSEIKMHGCANETHSVITGEDTFTKNQDDMIVVVSEEGESGVFKVTFPPR